MPDIARISRRHGRSARLALPLVAAALLAGCASSADKSIGTHGGAAVTAADWDEAASVWGKRYAADGKGRDTAMNYAAALRRTGRTGQAVAVLQRAAIHHPKDREVLAAYGKALAADGHLQQALQIIRRAQTPDQPDWKLLSAEAAILDQLGNSADARKLYLQALDLAPNEPTILSNLGMSYVMTEELPEAETYLKRALAAPGADSRVRQNLALVVGLRGRFAEAETIAAADLSPAEAQANVAYLRDMLNQQNSWQKLKAAEPAASRG